MDMLQSGAGWSTAGLGHLFFFIIFLTAGTSAPNLNLWRKNALTRSFNLIRTLKCHFSSSKREVRPEKKGPSIKSKLKTGNDSNKNSK